MRRCALAILAGFLLVASLGLHAAAESVALKLAPWPPDGWPGDRPGVLRLVLQDSRTPLLEAPITPEGWAIYDISAARRPQPSQLRPLYELLEHQLLDQLFGCSAAAPAVSPAEARAALVTFLVFPAGNAEPFAEVRFQTQGTLGFAGAFASSSLVYLDRDAEVVGAVVCNPGSKESLVIRTELRLPAGWSFVSLYAEASLGGTTTRLVAGRLPLASARVIRIASQ